MVIELSTPQTWEELSPTQVLFVASQYLIGVSREELLTRCFLKFTDVKLLNRYPFKNDSNIDVFQLKRKKHKFTLTAEQFYCFGESLSFLTDSIGLMPCPEIKGCQAPDYRLFNHTLEEYLTADNFYIQYSHTQKQGIDELIATLYRPDNVPFNDADICKRVRKTRILKPVIKLAVYLWYTGFKFWLRQYYPLVFTSPDEVSDTTPDKLIFGLLESLNDGKPHYNERILKTHFHEVFYSLNSKIEQSDKIKSDV